jgi:hypothetical protein
LRRCTQDVVFLRGSEMRAFDNFPWIRVADRERRVGAEHDTLRAGFPGEVFERIDIEHGRVKVQRCEAETRIGNLALRGLMASREASERISYP